MKIKLLLISIVFTSSFLPSPVNATPLTLEGLFSTWSCVKAEQKKFTEEQFDPFLEITTTLSGTLHYQAPDKLTQHYLSPIEGSVFFTPDTVRLDFPNRQLSLSTDSAPMLTMLSQTLLHLLNGNLEKLSQSFKLEFSEQGNQTWQLNLFPKNTLRVHLESIAILGVQQQILEIRINKGSGEWRKLSFKPEPVS